MKKELSEWKISAAKIYHLLEEAEQLLLLEDIGKAEYLIAIGAKKTRGEYSWEQVRYFAKEKEARNAFAVLASKENIGVGLRQLDYVAHRKKEIIKAIRADMPVKEIYRLYGEEAFLQALVWLVRQRPHLPPELKTWAAGYGEVPEVKYRGNAPTNTQIWNAWKDAKKKRLFYLKKENEHEK